MLSMTKWIYVIKDLLKSKRTRSEIRGEILDKCLRSSQKNNGAYQVDDSKVWNYMIMRDEDCKKRLEELHIRDVFGVYSYYEEIEYKKMRATYPKKRRKKGA